MLDTNIIAYANNDRYGVNEAFRRHRKDTLYLSAIALAELEYGVCKSSRPQYNQNMIALILTNVTVLPFDEKASMEYGRIRAELERQGTVIGANDMLIAAHAKSRGLTLVTNNTREFERVEGLRLENWIDTVRS
jgi:tRNA(fMet)-specific endonuclease VapC